MNLPLNWIDDLTALLPPGRVVTAETDVDRLSKDFYWYSPVLERQLREKRGDAAAQPRTVAEVRDVLSFAARRGIPVTVRGAATGNYGQCIPLEGGILLDLAALDRVLEISADGIATCEPGARLGVIESTARKSGWELRCYPSTYQKA
jgi:FAD/FMN-containing dehydrogenase